MLRDLANFIAQLPLGVPQIMGGLHAKPEAGSVYLLRYSAYLRYHEYLAAGLPIATGVIEGACRHLVKDRMELTGARWRLAGAEAVLRLRALRSSADLDERTYVTASVAPGLAVLKEPHPNEKGPGR